MIDIELHQVLSGAALEGVRDGTLDASFYFGAIDAGDLRGEPLRSLVYRVALPSEWGMGERHTDWNAIAARPWILAQREADPALEAIRAVRHDVWRHEAPAAA